MESVRAAATRNLDLVVSTGARLLAGDPSASIADIAAAAGVDRRTVYRRFASREELLAAVYQARYDAVEQAIDAARPRDAPLPGAPPLHLGGHLALNHKWPGDTPPPL